MATLGRAYVSRRMSNRLVLVWDAKSVCQAFYPVVTIRDSRGHVVFDWRGAVRFASMESALLFARDYGETALAETRKARVLANAADGNVSTA
jgi:hypothetical protein